MNRLALLLVLLFVAGVILWKGFGMVDRLTDKLDNQVILEEVDNETLR